MRNLKYLILIVLAYSCKAQEQKASALLNLKPSSKEIIDEVSVQKFENFNFYRKTQSNGDFDLFLNDDHIFTGSKDCVF